MADMEQGKQKVIARWKRAEGQLGAVIGMAEQEEDCERVAQQLAAVRKALDRAFFDMMAGSIRRELASPGEDPQAELDHVMDLLRKYA